MSDEEKDEAEEPEEQEEAEAESSEQPERRRLIPRRARNIMVSAFVLLILLVAGGFAYTYYMDQGGIKTPVASVSNVSQQESDQAPKTPTPAANAAVGVSIDVLSSPAPQGSTATASAETLQGAKCTISVMYGTEPASGPGLAPQVADTYGSVTWNWTIPATAPIGTWPVKVNCARNKQSGVDDGTIQITK